MARKFVFFGQDGTTRLTLGDDDAGDKISVGLPATSNVVDEVELVRSRFTRRIAVADETNITNTLEWVVDRDHGNELAATNFVRDHGQALLSLGAGYLQDGGKGVETRYWLNAVIEPRCLRHDGQSTVFSYTMRAGEVTKKTPT